MNPEEDGCEDFGNEDVSEMIEMDQAGGAAPEDGEDGGEGEEAPEGMDEGEEEEGEEFVDRGNNAALTFSGHKDAIFTVSVSPMSDLVLSGGQEDAALLWRITNGEVLYKFDGFRDSVTQGGFSKDGTFVAVGAMDGIIRIYSVQTGEVVIELDCGEDLNWLHWHPVGNFLLAGSASGSVYMWSIPAGQMSFFSGHISPCLSGVWMPPQGRSFVTVEEAGALIVWSPKTQDQILKVDGKSHQFHTAPINVVAAHKEGTLVATGSYDNTVKVINTKTGKVVQTLTGHTDNIEDIAFSNTEPILLATASLDGTCRIWNTTTNIQIATCQHEAGCVKALWHPSKPILYTCSLDGVVRVFEGRNGKLLFEGVGHQNHVLEIALADGGNTIVSCSEDAKVLVFNVGHLLP